MPPLTRMLVTLLLWDAWLRRVVGTPGTRRGHSPPLTPATRGPRLVIDPVTSLLGTRGNPHFGVILKAARGSLPVGAPQPHLKAGNVVRRYPSAKEKGNPGARPSRV